MLRILFSALFAIALPLTAQACGGKGDPCMVDGGHYHAVAPEGEGPHGALIFMHGYMGTGEGILRNKGMTSMANDRGYVLIAPQGVPRREGKKGGAWNAFANPERRDDVAYMQRVMADAVARFNIDPEQTVAAGFSGGGMMVWRIACDAPEDFAAYAPIAGLLWRPLPEECAGPVRMLHVHGWTDKVVPLEGRAVAGGRILQGDLFKGLSMMRRASGCVDAPDEFELETEPYMIRKWISCDRGARIEFALWNGGHGVPKGWSGFALDWFEALDGLDG